MSNDPMFPPRPARGFRSDSEPLPPAVEQIYLDRLKVAARGYITREALADQATARAMIDHQTDTMMIQLETTVLGHDRRTIEWRLDDHYPASWWQHFKRQHFPRWALKRWPCRYRKVERILALPMRTLYPEHPIPGGLGPVVFQALDPVPTEILPFETGGEI